MHTNPSSTQPGRRLVSLILFLSLLVGLSCNLPFNLPGITQPTEEVKAGPTASPTARPQPTPSTPLPPALVESTPLPNSEVGLKSPWVLYFNQAMDKTSVESSISAQPAVSGSFKWLNDATVTFSPSQPLPKDTALMVTISNQAKSASGLALSSPVELPFRTAAGFQAVERLPLPGAADIDPGSAVVVTFNHPVVALGADPSSLPVGFTLDPPANGRGEWLNTSTYIFYGNPGLAGGTKYTVRLNRDMAGIDGAGWASADIPDWIFSTSKPKVIEIRPADTAGVVLDTDVSVSFNQAMNSASLEKNFSLRSAGGAVAGKFTWNESKTILTFLPANILARNTTYTIAITGDAASQGGAQLEGGFNSKFGTVPDLSVISSTPAQNQTLATNDGQGSIRVKLSAPLGEYRNLERFVSFEPSVSDFSVSVGSYGFELFINGRFDGRKDYTLRISNDLTDKWGSKLKEPFLLRFKTGAPLTTFSLNIAQSYSAIIFLTPQDGTISARATNVKNINLGYASLSLNDFALAANYSGNDRAQKFSSLKLAAFSKTISLPADKNTVFDLPVTPGSKGLTPGLYYFTANSPEIVKPAVNPYPSLLVVSRVHLALKSSRTQVYAWAVDLDKNQPAANATVTFYSEDKGILTSLGTAKTNNLGVAELTLASPQDVYMTRYAVIGKPSEAGFALAMSDWNQGIGSWDMGISTDFSDETKQAYLYTDRPIYRPGQTVNYRVVLRQKSNGRYTVTDPKSVTVKLVSPYRPETGQSAVVATATLDMSDYGAVAGSFKLAGDTAPGYYSLELDKLTYDSIAIQVAEYRKPEIELKVDLKKAEIKAGEDFNAVVKAQYYFGAPVGSVKLSWYLSAMTDTFEIPGGYRTGMYDSLEFMPSWYRMGGFYGKTITYGTGITGVDGSFTVNVPANVIADAVEKQNRQTLFLNVSLEQENEYPVSTTANAIMNPADTFVGVKPEQWSGQAKSEMAFSLLTVDWKKSPVGGKSLTAVFNKVTWKQNENWRPESDDPSYTMEIQEIARTDLKTDGKGAARVAFTPPSAGTYMIDVQGDGARTQILLWVGGEGRAPWPVTPNQTIRLTLDSASYKPGQTASLFIPNPLSDNALALVTVERAKVMRTVSVSPVAGSNLTVNIPLEALDAPNVFISVLLIGKNESGQLDFRMGYVKAKVDPAALKLQVDLLNLPDKTAPASDLKFSLRVKDDQGKPVQGEFSLSVVDKAVLALADPNSLDIFNEYYSDQSLGVQNSLALGIYSQRMSMAPPGRGGGGGGGQELAPGIRERFEDTAYWNGKVVTDANGAAEISMRLPDNLTTWVVTVRGLTKDTRVGELVKEIVTSKDLLIRPFVPRFLVTGDRVQLSATVNNNTSRNLSVDVLLQASGLDLEDAKQATQKVDVPANGRKSVSWWARVPETDKVDLTFTARSGDLQDITKLANGALPVQQYSVPQTYGTNGILVEAGERLEVVSLPKTFTPTGGELRVELAPSLAAAVLEGLKAMDAFPYDLTEAVVSRLLPNLEMYRTIQSLNLDAPGLKDDLLKAIQDGLPRVIAAQNTDGGWGWASGRQTDPLISTYAFYTLVRAAASGFQVDMSVITKGQGYLSKQLFIPDVNTKSWMIDRLAFQAYALVQSGYSVKQVDSLYNLRARLSPWAAAMLAMAMDNIKSGDDRARTLLSGLAGTASRSSTGAFWAASADGSSNLMSTNASTAAVVLALSRLNPASPVLTEAVRYLVLHRRSNGSWSSSYETAWVLLSLTENLKGTGDLAANYGFSATLNSSPLLKGQASGPKSLTPVSARIPLRDLRPDAPNDLKLVHEAGNGRLYYRAFLQVYRPADTAQPVNRGLTIARSIYLDGQFCKGKECKPITEVKLGGSASTLLVRLTVTVPKQMQYLVVEDYIPAGSEILNLSLKTSQYVNPTSKDFKPIYNGANPFGDGWGWWWFGQPQIYDDHIRWVGSSIPAGTYELTYRVTPLQAGEFRLIPAHAYQYYFPDVEGTTSGSVFKILP